ncbi:MAG: TerC family protein [Chloroflexi bacterium]|nr:TerC family protein [Chloroflexota bacterium]
MSIDWTVWVGFVALIVVLLAIDLFVFHRSAHEVSVREAALWSAVWVGLGLGFGAFVWAWLGGTAAAEYLAGYLIEKSLSVDNIFVFAMIFSAFAVPAAYQHRVLFWGIFGALVLRAAFIGAGAALLHSFHWTIYLFGGLLVATGIRMVLANEHEIHPERNPLLRTLRRAVPMTPDYHGQALFVRQAGRWMATPLLAVLLVVETSDVIFAVDSIPAILAITDEAFLVFSSNAFALLGLRALYFVLAGSMDKFPYLKFGLAAILVLVGAKMLASDFYHVPIWLSLTVIGVILLVAMLAPLLFQACQKTEANQQTGAAS